MCHVWPPPTPPNDENPKLITFFLKILFSLSHHFVVCTRRVSGAGNPKGDRATTKKRKAAVNFVLNLD